MANTGFKGIDVRQTGGVFTVEAFLQDSTGAIVTSGTGTIRVYEEQDDGSLKSLDFDDGFFKTTALTTETASLTHRTGNNGTRNTGIWTYIQNPAPVMTVGALYFVQMLHSSAYPPVQTRKFQWGSDQGDLVTVALSTGLAYLKTAWDKANVEPSGVPTITATLLDQWAYLASLMLNEIQETSTNQKLKNAAGSGDISNSTLSDNGTTFVRGEPA